MAALENFHRFIIEKTSLGWTHQQISDDLQTNNRGKHGARIN